MAEFNINSFILTHKSLVNSKELIQSLPIGLNNNVNEIARNFYSQHTHAGLISYLYYCTGLSNVDSLTIIIRPDMLWFTILNEVVIYMNQNKGSFNHIFDLRQYGKNVYTRVNDGSAIDINELTERLRTFIINKDFFRLICETKYSSEVALSNYSIRMLFAFMGSTVTANNASTKTPDQKIAPTRNLNIKFVGSKKDWITLYKSVEKLNSYSPKINKKERGGFESFVDVNIYSTYIDVCKRIISNIMSSQNTNDKTFQYDIFRYVSNPRNVYHNKNFIVEGWARMLYMKSDRLAINEFNTHLNYIPYQKLDDNNTFCQISGLMYSNIYERDNDNTQSNNTQSNNTQLNNTTSPKTTVFDSQYGIVKLHIQDDSTYKELLNLNKHISHQRENNDINFRGRGEQTHLQTYDSADKLFVKHKNSFKDNHIMPMNPISSFPQARGTSTFLNETINGGGGGGSSSIADIHPDMRHSHQLNTIAPPQSVLFELKAPNENMGKTYGGDYIKAFERDDTIPMMGGSMLQ